MFLFQVLFSFPRFPCFYLGFTYHSGCINGCGFGCGQEHCFFFSGDNSVTYSISFKILLLNILFFMYTMRKILPYHI